MIERLRVISPRASTLLCAAAVGCTAGGDSAIPSMEAQRILRDERFEWVTIRSPHARIHFPAGSFAAAHRDVLPGRVEEARRDVLGRLGIADDAATLNVFYVDGRRDMKELVDSPVTGFAYYQDATVVLVFNAEWRAFERHELTHVVTHAAWPDTSGAAAAEGLATYVDGECGGEPNGRVARAILDRGEMIPLSVLTADFRHQNDLVAYMQAAGIVEFVATERGTGALRSLWSDGLEAAPDLLGMSPSEFDARLAQWLTETYQPVSGDTWTAIRGRGCGIDARPDRGG